MAEFVRSIAAQRVAGCIVDVARNEGLLDSPVTIAPRFAESEKVLIIKMMSCIHERFPDDQEAQLTADEVGSLFTFVFAKAAETVTNMYNNQEDKFELSGMLDGRIPLYADENITSEFKSSNFPVLCAENYLELVNSDPEIIADNDPVLLLFEALKWCFRLSCHYANTVVESNRMKQ